MLNHDTDDMTAFKIREKYSLTDSYPNVNLNLSVSDKIKLNNGSESQKR